MTLDYAIAFGAGLIVTLLAMPVLIPFLHKIKFGQVEREEGLASHKAKGGTPTMGGIIFVIVPVLIMLILRPAAFVNTEMMIVILAYLGYAFIGFIDDFIIVVKKNNEGLKPSYKFALQSLLAVIFYLVYQSIAQTSIYLPVLHVTWEMGFLYFVLVFVMFTAESNAVNFTDGLDGLCAGTSMIALFPYVIFALVQEKYDLALFLLAVSGSLLGYLKFNLHPAKIFMGDTGSLALGGLFAASAMVLKQEVLLVIIGGVFLAEMLSVVIQVGYYKKTKKRIFKMAPLHHHFELSGYKETQVVILFWSAGVVCALIGLLLAFI
ncbi:MAG: phospho-N-acetylmuramoyl-pentapeptide-transferase [Erysipelotrichaceae bacterium]|nr:phospho-N-acetylmuramoyl-pentapeptide-transferase [Erysipelotrichaceae bacterium]MCI9525193.1 phospho-N-acetylmuramoyl-pentapeptide-transferase [Erysipelotrichaceae bacterium]